jgi:hypothetical protein
MDSFNSNIWFLFLQREKSGTEHWQVFMMIKYESRENGNDQKIKKCRK